MIKAIQCNFRGVEPQVVSFEECRNCAKKMCNACKFPLPVVLDITHSLESDSFRSPYSPTGIQSCVRKTVLSQFYGIAVRLSDLYYIWRGNLLHTACEKALNIEVVDGLFGGLGVEDRIKTDITINVNNEDVKIKFSGQPDLVSEKLKSLWDWKTTNNLPNKPKEDHVKQMHAYKWLLELNNIKIDKAHICYFSFGDMITHTIDFGNTTNTIGDDIKGKCKQLYSYISSKMLPEPLKDKNELWECNWCYYRNICRELDCEIVELKTNIHLSTKTPPSF